MKAAFYFFLANYLSSHKEEPGCQQDIKTLASKLYREDAANVILFLCHIDPTPLIIDELLANAAKIFEGEKETDLTTDLEFTGDLVARLDQPVIEHGDPEKRRQQRLESQDALSQDDDTTADRRSTINEEAVCRHMRA